jgi:hypothetical protein
VSVLAPRRRHQLDLYAFLDSVDGHVRALRNASDAIVRAGNIWRNGESGGYVGVSLIVDGSEGELDIGLGFFDRNDFPLLVTGAQYRCTSSGAVQLARDISTLLTTFF